MRELGGDSGAIWAVEEALRSMAKDNDGIKLEDFEVSGKSRVMVLTTDRTWLMGELPESNQFQENMSLSDGNVNNGGGVFGGHVQRGAMQDMWMGPGGPSHLGGMQPGGIMGTRGPRGMGMMGMGRGAGVHPMHRPSAPLPNGGGGVNTAMLQKPRTEEDDMKDLEALLKKKSFMELQKSKTGEELLDLIHRPTARETAVAEKVFVELLESSVMIVCVLMYASV